MHTFKKKKSDGQKDDMRFLTLVTGNFHGILHHVISKISCALTTAPKIHSAYIKVTVTLHQPIAASAGVQNLNLIASMQLSLPKSS